MGFSLAEVVKELRVDMYILDVASESRKRIAIGPRELQAQLEEIEALGLPLVNYFIRYPGHSAADMGIFPDK